MTDQFVGEIRLGAFNFPPTGWAFCRGQLVAISQNTALFSLLGTNFGGDGKATFALPDLRGAVPIGTGYDPTSLGDVPLGMAGGAPTVQLLQSEIPVHTHGVQVTPTAGTTGTAAGSSFAVPRTGRATEAAYGTAGTVPLAQDAFGAAGGSQPHNNLQPYLALNFIIALQGIFPWRP
ncbi:phage tail protein [Leifsonia sp. NPDC058194]|uniref:phage tail protein n=1 Tax=Leifsonia sp. NPDC058194 TaxID=3346374 RepID=UPI0036D83F20